MTWKDIFTLGHSIFFLLTVCGDLDACTWFLNRLVCHHQVDYLISSNDREVSTTLLIIPEFSIGNIEAFTAFTDTLTHPLEPLGLEKLIQLVYFHPQWVFRDGADRMGEGSAANFARRSPYPMINILRTNQVRVQTARAHPAPKKPRAIRTPRRAQSWEPMTLRHGLPTQA